jgi:hypothetical protein
MGPLAFASPLIMQTLQNTKKPHKIAREVCAERFGLDAARRGDVCPTGCRPGLAPVRSLAQNIAA